MPSCEACGAKTTHLHTGGDARIPEPGVCSMCEPILAAAARAKIAAKRDAGLVTYAQDIGLAVGASQSAPPAASGGKA